MSIPKMAAGSTRPRYSTTSGTLPAPGAEHQKGRTGEHGRRRTDGDGQDELEITHRTASLSLASMGRRSRSEGREDADHRGDEEAARAKDAQADQRRSEADDGAGVLLFLLPLIEEDDHKHGRHDKIHALGAEGQDCAEAAPMAALATQ